MAIAVSSDPLRSTSSPENLSVGAASVNFSFASPVAEDQTSNAMEGVCVGWMFIRLLLRLQSINLHLSYDMKFDDAPQRSTIRDNTGNAFPAHVEKEGCQRSTD